MLFHVTGSAIFLADTIHALPAIGAVLPEPLWEIQKNATRVMFETDLDRLPSFPDNALLGQQFQLSSLIPAETFNAALSLWSKYGIGLSLETLKPWCAGLVLANAISGDLSFDPKFGVDKQMWEATAPEKRVLLEGTEALTAFDNAPLEEQAAYLAMIARTPHVVIDRLERLYRYWQTNDVHGFEQELQIAKLHFPTMFAGLIDQRNTAWLPAILESLTRQTPTLVLVGALHLVGPTGLPELLRRNGHATRAL